MTKTLLTIARNGCQVFLCDVMVTSWLTMVDPEETISTWFDHDGHCFSSGMMVWSMVNHDQMVMVIFSQSWS